MMIIAAMEDGVEKCINPMWIGADMDSASKYKHTLSLHHKAKPYTIFEKERHTPYYKNIGKCLIYSEKLRRRTQLRKKTQKNIPDLK